MSLLHRVGKLRQQMQVRKEQQDVSKAKKAEIRADREVGIAKARAKAAKAKLELERIEAQRAKVRVKGRGKLAGVASGLQAFATYAGQTKIGQEGYDRPKTKAAPKRKPKAKKAAPKRKPKRTATKKATAGKTITLHLG